MIKNFKFRIKPAPKYRPFANAEECWAEMLKHQPFGVVKDKYFANYQTHRAFTCLVTNGCHFRGYEDETFESSFKNLLFADGTPFGIKVEEQHMILYQIWCKRTYVSGGFCEGEDEPTQLIFTTLDKARSKIPKDHYSKENGSREYYIKKIEIE